MGRIDIQCLHISKNTPKMSMLEGLGGVGMGSGGVGLLLQHVISLNKIQEGLYRLSTRGPFGNNGFFSKEGDAGSTGEISYNQSFSINIPCYGKEGCAVCVGGGVGGIGED